MNNKPTLPSSYPVACHTDNIGPGSVFVAIKGHTLDGADYIVAALAKGAHKIVVEDKTLLSDDVHAAITQHNAELVYVADTRKALATLSVQALGNPAQKLKLIGITGTKGKTTTTFILENILRGAGKHVALLSTVHNKIDGHVFKTHLTTQQPDYLHVFFNECVKSNVEYVVMEVAAQALTLHRVAGLQFDAGIFTNFSLEHSEFYDSMDEYFAAKSLLLQYMKPGIPLLINSDDGWCKKLIDKNVQTLSLTDKSANIFIQTKSDVLQHVAFTLNNQLFECPMLVGKFNVYNVACAVNIALQCGLSSQTVALALKMVEPIPGRLEKYILPNGATCFIDYAHNPSSFKALFAMLRKKTEHLIVVFGAGGGKDKNKRPLMGAIAAEYADVVVLTSDNPRDEDPAEIIIHILDGIDFDKQHKVIQEIDRKKAIKKAYLKSEKGSIMVLLGKGPDEYQIVGTKRHYFSEKEIIQHL